MRRLTHAHDDHIGAAHDLCAATGRSPTVVHTGRGDDTTIGAEAPHLQAWLERGC